MTPVAWLLTGIALQEPVVTLDRPFISYEEIAKELSVGGKVVQCDPRLASRVAVLRLTPRPWSRMVDLLGQVLDVEVVPRSAQDGTLTLRESAAVADRERLLFDRYTSLYSSALGTPSKTVLDFLGPNPKIDGGLAQRYSPTLPVRDGKLTPEAILIPPILVGLTSFRDASSRYIDPVGLLWFGSSGLDPLVREDRIWSRPADLPAWVRWSPGDLAQDIGQNLSPAFRAEFNERAEANASFLYRLSFDPRDGLVRTVRAVTFGANTAPGTYVERPFRNEDWNPEPDLGAFVPARDSEYKNRRSETSKFLASDDASAEIPRDASVARTLWLWARQTDRELAMEVAPLRDALPNEGFPGSRTLKVLLGAFDRNEQAVVDAFQGDDSDPAVSLVVYPRALVKGRQLAGRLRHRQWSVRTIDHVLNVRNEWHFLDRRYAPSLPGLCVLESSRDKEGRYPLAALDSYVQGLSARDSEAFARCDLGFGLPRLWSSSLLLRLVGSLPDRDRQAFWSGIVGPGHVATVELGVFPRAALQAYARSRRTLTEGYFDAEAFGSNWRPDLDALIVSGGFEEALRGAILQGEYKAGVLGLAIKLPAESLRSVLPEGRKRAETLAYETIGPLSLP